MISEIGAEVALTQAGFPTLIPLPHLETQAKTQADTQAETQVGLESRASSPLLFQETMPVTLEILENGLMLSAEATQTGFDGEFPTVRLMFESVGLSQQRQLVEMLFCRPGQWKNRYTPGELQSLWLLFRILLRPKVLFDRNAGVSAVSVAQV